MRRRAPHIAAIASACVLTALAFVYATALPPGGGPDEDQHARYVDALARDGRLPIAPGHAGPHERWRECAQIQHPPLYYMLLAPVRAATLATVGDPLSHAILRLCSTGMVLIAALCLWLAARNLWPSSPWRAAAAVCFLALLPQTQYMAAQVNNSCGALMAGAIAVLLCARLTTRADFPVIYWLYLAVAAAAALAMKLTGVWVLFMIVVCAAAKSRNLRLGLRKRLLGFAAILILVTATLLPWVLHNLRTNGAPVPLRVTGRSWVDSGAPGSPGPLDALIAAAVYAPPAAVLTFASPFWLLRTHYTPPAALLFTMIWFLPALLSVSVHAWRRAKTIRVTGWRPRDTLWAALGGAMLVMYATVCTMVVFDYMVLTCPGRYVWEAAPVVALIWAAAMGAIAPRALRRWLTGALVAGMGFMSLWVCNWVLLFAER